MFRATWVVARRIAIVAVIGLLPGGATSAQADPVSTPMVVPAADRDAAQRALEIIAGRIRETNAAGMKSVAADPDFNKAWGDFKGYVQAFGSAGLNSLINSGGNWRTAFMSAWLAGEIEDKRQFVRDLLSDPTNTGSEWAAGKIADKLLEKQALTKGMPSGTVTKDTAKVAARFIMAYESGVIQSIAPNGVRPLLQDNATTRKWLTDIDDRIRADQIKQTFSQGTLVIRPQNNGAASSPAPVPNQAAASQTSASQNRVPPRSGSNPVPNIATAPVAPRPTAPMPSAQPARFAPGGISLSKAAAERMPLNLSLDSAYLEGDRLVLSGPGTNAETIDAALFLTALRATCEGADPYFSLDPDNMAAWMSETHQAGEEFHARTKADTGWSLRKGARASTPSILNFRTVSASHDYPDFWRSVLVRYPNMRSRLVFKPEWLRQTRFGEVLYKADVLLKELAGGAPALDVAKLRAAKVDSYRSATAFRAASSLLDKYYERSDTKEAKGGRIWYDFADTPRSPGEHAILSVAVAPQPYPRSELLTLVSQRGLLKDPAGVRLPSYGESDGIVDLSQVFPRMYVRVRDPVTLKDGSGNYPGLDELVSEANTNPAKYAAAYREYQLLVEVFRAYAIAVRVKATRAGICRVVPKEILAAEKIDRPLPDYHPTELTETIAWYEYSDRRMRRAIGTSGGLFQGGVSVGATSFMANAARRVVDTPLIREIRTEASVAPQENAWSSKAGRQFVAFRIDEYPEGVKVTPTRSGSLSPPSPTVPAQSLELAAPQPNQKVAATVLPQAIKKLPETVKALPSRPAEQKFTPSPATSQSSQAAPIGVAIFVIAFVVFVVRLVAVKPGSQPATAGAASTAAVEPATPDSPPKDATAAYNAAERDFKNVFAMKSMADRETMIRSWRTVHGGSRENAMTRLVEHWRQDNR
jgi:hypothetical protein